MMMMMIIIKDMFAHIMYNKKKLTLGAWMDHILLLLLVVFLLGLSNEKKEQDSMSSKICLFTT